MERGRRICDLSRFARDAAHLEADRGCDARLDRVEAEDLHRHVSLSRCRAEVILAAGVYGSPQLLEMSGIGKAERLKMLGHCPCAGSASRGQKPSGPLLHTVVFRCTKPSETSVHEAFESFRGRHHFPKPDRKVSRILPQLGCGHLLKSDYSPIQ